jgi:hypothetical protein
VSPDREKPWGEDTVALRGSADREDDRERSERLRIVAPSKRRAPTFSRWIAVGGLAVSAVVVAAITLGGSPQLEPTPQAGTPARQPALQAKSRELAKTKRQLATTQKALRRAATQKKEIAKRGRGRRGSRPAVDPAPIAVSPAAPEYSPAPTPPAPESTIPPETALAPASEPSPKPAPPEFGL